MRSKKLREQWEIILAARLPHDGNSGKSWSAEDVEWIDRLLAKTRRTQPPKDEHSQDVLGPCWTFIGYIKNSHGRDQENGYPYMRYGKKLVRAHKHIMVLLGHDYTRTCVTEHLCRNRRCCNPQHLEVIQIRENTIRGLTGEQLRTKKCRTCGSHDGKTVHKHTPDGKHIQKWVCRPCTNKRKREQYQRRKRDERKSPERPRATPPSQHELLRGRARGVRGPHDPPTHGEGRESALAEQGPAKPGDQASEWAQEHPEAHGAVAPSQL